MLQKCVIGWWCIISRWMSVLLANLGYGNMAEWSKAPESGHPVYLVRKGEGSNPSVVIRKRISIFL